MDDGDLNTESVRNLRSVSTKFSYKMQDIDYCRPLVLAFHSYMERLTVLFDETYSRIFGSMGEGTQYPHTIVQDRDMDIIKIYPKTRAVEDVREKDQYDRQTYVYLVENNNTLCPPGYCFLRMLNDGSSPVLQFLHLYKELYGEKYILSSTSRVVTGLLRCSRDEFTHIYFPYDFLTIGKIGERGPAINTKLGGVEIQSARVSSIGTNITKVDHVSVIYCPKWPSCASEWVTRLRHYGWPSQHQISDIVKKGIYFAPVGSKQSKFQDIQWRYSFNEAEKILVRSFNFTQVKCYVLLKMLISKNVTPCFKDHVISSYHLKTLMFWTIEQTDPQLWVSRSLVEMVFRVLSLLFLCVKKLFCSSYFIQDENLFAGKITTANMEAVCQALSNIICEGWVALTRLDYFARDDHFIQSLYQDNDIVYQPTVPTKQITDLTRLASSMCYEVKIDLTLKLLAVASSSNINEADKIDANFNEVINKLLLEIHHTDDIRDKEILQSSLAFVWCSYGTHLLSLLRCPSVQRTERNIMEELGLVCTNLSCKSNLAECLAKHANYTYITGDFQSTIAITQKLLNRCANLPLHQPAATGNIPAFYHYCEQELVNVIRNEMNVDDIFDNFCKVGCIIFMKNEIYALPDDARIEMFHVLGAEDNFRTECRLWFGLSPFLYVAYLAFLVSFDSGHLNTAEAYLRIMESMCSKPPTSYESSSLNLLGVCYVKMGHLDKAMETFYNSVRQQRCKSAAVWHVACLLWRELQYRWMKTS